MPVNGAVVMAPVVLRQGPRSQQDWVRASLWSKAGHKHPLAERRELESSSHWMRNPLLQRMMPPPH